MKTSHQKSTKSKSKPLMTDEAQVQRCTALAYDLVEERLRDKTASATETVHFLKLGTAQAKLELEKLELENRMIEAKTKAVNSSEDLNKKMEAALKAFAGYAGLDSNINDEELF